MPPSVPAPRPTVSAASSAPRKRVALYDNLKGILIVLVVFGHMMHPVHNTNQALSTCFDLIYLFHMPLFVFLSGLFAKGAYRDGKLNVNRIVSFLVMGFCYQAALLAINGVLLDKPWRLLLFTSAPWYLVGMAGWYALTPLLSRLGPVRGMAASLAVSLVWGCVDLSDGLLALSRTLAFLPCFAAGYYCPLDFCVKLKQRRSLWIAVATTPTPGPMAPASQARVCSRSSRAPPRRLSAWPRSSWSLVLRRFSRSPSSSSRRHARHG